MTQRTIEEHLTDGYSLLSMNEPIKIVAYSDLERGGRGYVKIDLGCHEGEDIVNHSFYLDEAEALALGYALEVAVKRGGLGQPPKDLIVVKATHEQLMDRCIWLCFSDDNVPLDPPRDCHSITRQDREIKIISSIGHMALLSCSSNQAAANVEEALQLNELFDVHLNNEIVKMSIRFSNVVHAAGLSADEIAELNRNYQRVAEDRWINPPKNTKSDAP